VSGLEVKVSVGVGYKNRLAHTLNNVLCLIIYKHCLLPAIGTFEVLSKIGMNAKALFE